MLRETEFNLKGVTYEYRKVKSHTIKYYLRTQPVPRTTYQCQIPFTPIIAEDLSITRLRTPKRKPQPSGKRIFFAIILDAARHLLQTTVLRDS